VVHALSIEDSDTTPAEAVAELIDEIVRLRASHAALLAAAREAVSLIDGRVWTEEKMKLQAAIAAAEKLAP
jgi:hypothetical protein